MSEFLKPVENPPDPFDRRDNRVSTQWVRDAFADQSSKIDKIADDVGNISRNLDRSWQGTPTQHWDEHELFREREVERQRLEALRIEKEKEREKFWQKIKSDVIAYSLKAAGLFFIGIIVLGSQAKFKEWVQAAVADEKKIEAPK
jgi:hypothetical protein